MMRRWQSLAVVWIVLAATPAAAQFNYYNVDGAKQKPTPQVGADANTAGKPPLPSVGADPDNTDAEGDAGADPNNPPIYPAQSSVVTSLQSCLDQLDPSEAVEIKRNYSDSYAVCQERLAEKKTKTKQSKAAKSAPPPAETPRNFVRVKPAADMDGSSLAGVAPADAAAKPPVSATGPAGGMNAATSAPADAEDDSDAAPQTGSWHASGNLPKSKGKSAP